MKRIVVGAASAVLLLAGCASTDAPDGDVGMTAANMFDPEDLTVTAGDTVTFTNPSSQAHTVTAYEDDIPEDATFFASGGADGEAAARSDVAGGLIDPGDTYEVTFDVPGTYRYFCIPHETQGMVGTIVVEDA